METPCQETEKLIRCTVTNRYREQSVRFVEFQNFRLWEYLMHNKHQAKITDISLCLWLIDHEYANNESIYSRSGSVEPVSRIVVDLFDEEYGFSNPVIRYTRTSEADNLKKILCSHLPKTLLDSDNCTVRSENGFAISQYQHKQKRPVMMGLEFFEH